jgi:hypothetical protein
LWADVRTVTAYRDFFDKVYERHKMEYRRMASSGGRNMEYYYLQYPLMGLLDMFEATRTPAYLEEALGLVERMIVEATIIDRAGYRNWPGPYQSPWADRPVAYRLWEMQGALEMARLARIVLTDQGLTSTYGSRGRGVYTFVKHHTVEKWLYHRKELQTDYWMAGDRSREYPGKATTAVRMLLDIHRVDQTPKYRTDAVALLQHFLNRLTVFRNNSLVWDLGVNAEYPGHAAHAAPDTQHAGRKPMMIVYAYEAGIGGVTPAHLTGLASLLTSVIWDASLANPRFTNYIDGNNSAYRGRTAWNNGAIYAGWQALGAYDARAQQVAQAVVDAMIAGVRNPSVDYNATDIGQLALTGRVVKNRAILGRLSEGRRSYY